MPLVSIVVPVYNAQAFLSICVESILNQTFDDFELLLIDDGSKDQSLQVMHELSKRDTRIRLFHHENHGAGYTRNRGIQFASGQYITFIDADDFVDNNYLETFMNEIGNNDVLISGYKKVTMKSHDVLFTSIPLDCEWTEFKYVSTCAKLYALNFLKENHIQYAPLKIGEDVYFNLTINSKTENIKIISYAGYNYCLNENSVTQNRKTLVVDNKILSLLNQIYNDLSLEKKYSNKMIQYFYLKTVVQFLLMQVNVCDKKTYLQLCHEAFNFLKYHGYNGYSPVKEEEFKIRICVFAYWIANKMHLHGLLYSLVRPLHLQIG